MWKNCEHVTHPTVYIYTPNPFKEIVFQAQSGSAQIKNSPAFVLISVEQTSNSLETEASVKESLSRTDFEGELSLANPITGRGLRSLA